MKKSTAIPLALVMAVLSWSARGFCAEPEAAPSFSLPGTGLAERAILSSLAQQQKTGPDTPGTAFLLGHLRQLGAAAAIGAPQPAAQSVLSRMRYQRYGLRLAGGISRKSDIQTYGINPFVGFKLPTKADDWFARHGIKASWVVEGWAAYLRDDKEPFKTDSLEIGFNPLMIRLNFHRLGFVSPYLEGGEGLMYIDLRGQELGTRFQFASQFGGGFEIKLGKSLNLELSYRYRHLSNLGMASNPGVNTQLGLVGVSYRLP